MKKILLGIGILFLTLLAMSGLTKLSCIGESGNVVVIGGNSYRCPVE